MQSNFIKNLKINLNFNNLAHKCPTHYRLYMYLKSLSEKDILKMFDSESFLKRLLAHRFTDFKYIDKALSDNYWEIRLCAHLSTDFNHVELALNDENDLIKNLAMVNKK
jgi:hypothetical protein